MVSNLISSVKDDDDQVNEQKNANPRTKLFQKTCLKVILNLLRNEKDDKVKVGR
jgi:hypothetical protein